MIIHCTRKLAAKMGRALETPRQEASLLGSWHAHLYLIDRRQCVFFCHDRTRYVLVLPGVVKDNFAELALLFRAVYLQSLAFEGVDDAGIKKVSLAMGPQIFDAVTDRSVLSSLSVVRRDVDAYLADYAHVLDVDPFELMQWLNQRPTMARGRAIFPKHEMFELIATL